MGVIQYSLSTVETFPAKVGVFPTVARASSTRCAVPANLQAGLVGCPFPAIQDGEGQPEYIHLDIIRREPARLGTAHHALGSRRTAADGLSSDTGTHGRGRPTARAPACDVQNVRQYHHLVAAKIKLGWHSPI